MAQDGRGFEQEIAEMIGGELVPNSGQGRWAKMDARGLDLIISCKWTHHNSRSITPVEFAEVAAAVHGPGGYGDAIPAMAIGLNQFSAICLETHWFMEFIKREAPTIQAEKAEARRIHAGKTPLMRGEE